jgi:maltose/moltooligosaccharide transporter
MSIGFLGIQFGWGLQMANMSAIYEYLGAQPDKIPILWLAAPLTGLFVQPIIGHLSDHTWCRLGRRRPYFLIGAVLASASIFMMPYSGALIMAAGLLWVLDASVNISMEPFRAFVADLLPDEQRTLGFTMQGVFIGIGAVTASALPWALTNVLHISPDAAGGHAIPSIVRISFHIGAVIFFTAVMWTVFSTREHPPENMAEFNSRNARDGGAGRMFSAIFRDFLNMPRTMRELAWVQVFTWMGLFCMFIYFPVAVANNIFGAAQGSPEYLRGVEWAGLCFAGYNLVCFFFSMLLPAVAGRLGRRYTHMICLLAGAFGLAGILFVHDKYALFVLMIGVGIAWASTLSMPYAILSKAIPRNKMGVYMGIFNFFITIPEILVSLAFGLIMKNLLGNDRILGVVAGGICMAIAALLVLRVKERSEEPEILLS